MSLRPHEQRVLVRIEERMSRDDPALAGLLARPPAGTVGRRKTTVLTSTRRFDVPIRVWAGVILGTVVVALAAGAVEIALLVVAVVVLLVAHILRWRARRAVFRRFSDRDTPTRRPGRTVTSSRPTRASLPRAEHAADGARGGGNR